MSAFWLAWRYIRYHRGRTAILIAAISLTMFLPLATRWMIASFQAKAMDRASRTPLVVGTKGSRFAVALHSLYFRGESPTPMKYAEVERLRAFNLAELIPLHSRFRTRDHAIVGTIPAYFSNRQLVLSSGEPMSRYGDCVVGASAAKRLAAKPGDSLLSESENLFDLSGAAPLRMRVTGILEESGTADDDVVFCELETAWIMEGIGHGHALKNDESGEHTHEASRQNLSQHQEVTAENLRSFHFHGSKSEYPITAIIAVPDSDRSATLLQGKYLEADQQYQIIRPLDVIDELMQVVGRVRGLFDIGMIGLAIITFLLVALVLLLSLRLRQREMRTMFLLGCNRGRIAQIVGAELTIVVLTSVAVALIAASLLTTTAESLMLRLL